MRALKRPSPNHGPRKGGAAVDMVVLHYTAMESAEASLARLCDPAAEVSAHYLIDLDGTLWQLVAEDRRAWHAGLSHWQGESDVNSRSIGIELQNRGDHPFPVPQMRALEALLADIRARHAIPPERVLGHSDIAPERKGDPGARFDWRGLARAGHALWVEGTGGSDGVADLMRAAGYDPAAGAEALLSAFRLRFGPLAGLHAAQALVDRIAPTS
ncbi:MAG: N-acetylmuramoyl-L-alanine amidase [Rubricella sp.]